MKCNSCYHEISTGTRFCAYCGTPTTTVKTAPSAPPTVSSSRHLKQPAWPWIWAAISGILLIYSLVQQGEYKDAQERLNGIERYIQSDEYKTSRANQIVNSDNPIGELGNELAQKATLDFGGAIVSKCLEVLDKSTAILFFATIIFLGIGIYNLKWRRNSVSFPVHVEKMHEIITSPEVKRIFNNTYSIGISKIKSTEKVINETIQRNGEFNYSAKIWSIAIVLALLGKIFGWSGLFTWNLSMTPFGYFAWKSNQGLLTIANIQKIFNDDGWKYIKASFMSNISYPPLLAAIVGSVIMCIGQINGLLTGSSLSTVMNDPEFTSKNYFWVSPFFWATIFKLLIKSLELQSKSNK